MRILSFVIASLVATSLIPHGIKAEDSMIPLNGVVGFNPVGNPLVGVPTQQMATSLFGSTVVLAKNGGRRLFIGSPTHGFATPTADDASVNQDGGAVFLYEWNDVNASWDLLWFLPGQVGEALGNSVAMSGDGSRVALRRRRGNGPAIDFVEMYEISGNRAMRLGVPVGCVGLGSGVAMAPSGERIAVSCESFDNERGRVEVFDFDGSVWNPTGVFEGDSGGSLFGWSTSFSSDGRRLAISAPLFSDEGNLHCGSVQVFELQVDKSWSQVGGTLMGYAKFENFGMSLDLSGDGRTLVAGAPGSDSNDLVRSGAVRAFFAFRGMWLQTGLDITGVHAGDEFGEAVSISNNGGRVVASSSNHDSSSGHIRLFNLHLGQWTQHGEDITGLQSGTRLGYGRFGLFLDGEGDWLAYGSPFCGLAGCVHVMEYANVPQVSVRETVQPEFEEQNEADSGSRDWDIRFVNATVQFSDFDPPSITIDYKIHADDGSIDVLGGNCDDPIDESVFSTQTRIESFSLSEQTLSVELEFNLEDLAGSTAYTEPEPGIGLLTVCIRVDLLDENMESVTFDQRRFSVLLDTSVNFHAVEVETIEAEETVEISASVEYTVEACQCDQSLTCIDDPVGPAADTMICIEATKKGVRVASVQDLRFFKGSLSQIAVDEGQKDDLTIVHSVGDGLVVRTRLVSAFFEGDASAGIQAIGSCTLSLTKNGRSLVDQAISTSRALTESNFSIDLRIEKAQLSVSKHLSILVTIVLVALSSLVLKI